MNSTHHLHSYNPVNGQLVGSVPRTPLDQIPSMIARAQAAAPEWAALGLEGRKAVLQTAADRMIKACNELGLQLTHEMGKPLPEAVAEIRGCGAGMVRELDEICAALRPEIFADERTHSSLHYDPYGVCAVITPWNFPFAMPHWLLLPALVAGNTVLFKPSEETPLTGQAYADVLGADLPDGVLQIVHGADEQGKALVNGAVDLVAFTGSREVGKTILKSASQDLKRVILELGGKDPLLVLDDANIAKAARFAAGNSFRNAGQVCVSTERIYVHDAIADSFIASLVEAAEAFQPGDGTNPGIRMGPMINQRQRHHVLTHIDDAVQLGAQLVAGGVASEDGAFLSPTVLDGVDHSMLIAREETFGPVAAIIRVHDEDEAIRLANDSQFGLGAIVFSEDTERAEKVARQLKAGMVGINRSVGGAPGTPWVGARQSGYGYHKSTFGHRQFTQVRVLSRRV